MAAVAAGSSLRAAGVNRIVLEGRSDRIGGRIWSSDSSRPRCRRGNRGESNAFIPPPPPRLAHHERAGNPRYLALQSATREPPYVLH
jgi:hypothetical protein